MEEKRVTKTLHLLPSIINRSRVESAEDDVYEYQIVELALGNWFNRAKKD